MEVKTTQTGSATRPFAAPWLTPVYVVGLLLVLIGERVLPTIDTARAIATGLGVLGVVGVTVMRFATMGAGKGQKDADERASALRTMALLSLGGVLALAVYGATTDMGKELLGVALWDAKERARFDAVATIAYVVLVITTTLPILFGELAIAPMRNAPLIEGRRVRAATVAGISIAFAAAYAGLFVYTASELQIKADYSFYRTAKASESSKNIAASATEPIQISTFFPELNDVGTEVRGYLDELAKASSNVQVQHYDRLLVPGVAKDMKVTQDGVIVVKRGDSDQKIIIGADMKTAAAKLKTIDADMQKALLKSLRPARNAYLTVGHGELNDSKNDDERDGRSAKNLKRFIEMQNYTVKDLGIAQGLANDVPSDATLVVVAGPTEAFLPEEISSIRRYAERGGRLLLLLDPEAKIDLGPLAATVDLTATGGSLASDKNFIPRRRNPSDRANIVSNRFSSHASVSTLSREGGRAAVVLFGATSLDKAPGTTARVDFILKSLPEVWNDDDGDFEMGANEKRTTYNLAAAVTKPTGAAPEPKKDEKAPANAENEMRAVVFADADLFADFVLVQAQTNVVLLLDAVRWLGGEESFAGAVESTEDVRIEHTTQGDKIGFYATIFGMPTALLGMGFWMSRKRTPKKGKPPTKGDGPPKKTANNADETTEKTSEKSDEDTRSAA